MMEKRFIHLSTHSAYSLSEGAIPLEQLIKLAVANKMPAIGITDSDNLFGALEFAQKAAAQGLKPLMGCQVTLLSDADAYKQHSSGSHRITLLAQNETGWRNLMKLVSQSYLDNEKMLVAATSPAAAITVSSHVTLELLARYAPGIIAFSGGWTGEICLKLRAGQDADAEKLCDQLAKIFPDRFYIEIQRYPEQGHILREGWQRSYDEIEKILIDWAYGKNIPLIATNDVYFATPAMYEAHDVLLAVAEGVTRDVPERRRVTPHHYFKSPAQMAELFADLPEAIANSLVIAQRCSFWPKHHAPILPPFLAGENAEPGRAIEQTMLRDNAENGLRRRLAHSLVTHPPITPDLEKTYWQRLEFELGVINKMGYDGYFLIVADFINWAKQRGIPVGPGRGSGVGSLVAYAIQITDLDPIPYNLLFERFLNPDRVSLPDFDVDFCQDRRDEVIEYVRGRYGDERVAQIITFGKFQARAVLRDVGRVLGMPYGQVDRICKIVPQNPANPISLAKAIDSEPQLKQQRDSDPDIRKLLEIGMQLEGLYRHASTHAAGVVIGDRPLTELLPLYRDPRASLPATQYSMKIAEQAGLVKFDFLGLKTLTVIAKTIQLIEQGEGRKIELAELPMTDAAVWRMLAAGDTTGVFQLESSGMRDLAVKLKIDRFEEIIAVVALFRPGPMENIPSFINRKLGKEKSTYLHPALEGILRETFGIMVYQEQVMQAAQEMAGFTLAQADLLRRAMGKKDPKEMAKLSEDFAAGAAKKHGLSAKDAKHIFDQMEKFAGYGFNKSHSAAYALVTWQTAWLKCHYPAEFFAASMTLDMNNTDKLDVLRQEIARSGLELLPPDLNHSQVEFSVEKISAKTEGGKGGGDTPKIQKKIRYGLAAVKNVGPAAMQKLVDERMAAGKFASVINLAERIDPQGLNKRQIEQLAAAGAFDGILPNRALVYGCAEGILAKAAEQQRAKQSNQSALFGAGGGMASGSSKISGKTSPSSHQAQDASEKTLVEHGILSPSAQITNWSDEEKRGFEKAALGFYLTAHPLADDRPRIAAIRRIATSKSLNNPQILSQKEIQIAALVLECRERTAKSGNKFAFVQLSDEFGGFEIMVFQSGLEEFRNILQPGHKLLLTLKSKEDNRSNNFNNRGNDNTKSGNSDNASRDSGQRLLLEKAELLDKYLEKQISNLHLSTWSVDTAQKLQQLLAKSEHGKVKLTIHLRFDHQHIQLRSRQGLRINDEMLRHLSGLPDLTLHYGVAS
ncbi:MAG: DNA polymerase III subunit alpha [Candidatus Symbiobacter sp.]|nr:DNA polymerase III subunit alpha [Candidatus Symbiobacter sp.]